MDNNKKSPLKEQPLRQAGQSSYDKIFEYAFKKMLFPLFCVILAGFAAFNEWVRYFLPQSSPHPYFLTSLFIVILVWAILNWKSGHKKIARRGLGLRGERMVGQQLEKQLIPKGFRVFHDVLGRGNNEKQFNIDHVLIGSRGIFTVETKTWSKDRKSKIESNGADIVINGYPEKDILRQPRAEAIWLSDLFDRKTEKKISVNPILAFPGWWIEPSARELAQKNGVLLINPKAIWEFIKQKPEILSKEDIALFENILSSYVHDFIENEN